MKRVVTSSIVWKCRGGLGQHHTYYDLTHIRARKLSGGEVQLYFGISEADDGESVPCGRSETCLQKMRTKLEEMCSQGILKSISSNTLRSWPNELMIFFVLQKGQPFFEGAVEMCLKILDVLEARYPDPQDISVERKVSFEIDGRHVPEAEWIVGKTSEAIENHVKASRK